MPTKTQKAEKKKDSLALAVVSQMATLATSGFGLVAALAWNNVIQELVNNYIKKWLPQNSGIISLLIYAISVTVLAVFITYQLTHIKEELEHFRK